MFTHKRNLPTWIGVVAILLTAFLALTSSASAQTPSDGLFVDAAKPVGVADAKPTIARARYVGINFGLLDKTVAPTRPRATASVNKTLKLNLFADATVTAVLDRSQVRPTGLTWVGHVDGIKNSSVIFTQQGNALVGNIRTGKASYQVRYLTGTTHAIYQINEKAYPPERNPLKVDKTKLPAVTIKTTDTGSTIDMLVVYTPAAMTNAGGQAALEALIQLAIAEGNQAFADTPINPVATPGETLKLNLVRTEAVNYIESGDMDTDLTRLQNPTDGVMDNVPSLRDRYGADAVTLVVESSQYCGVAYDIMDPVSTSFAPYGYDLVARDCMVGNYTFVHELGHLMSARHDRDADPTENSPYPYNHGYIAPSYLFRTIMAYYNPGCEPNGCPRVGVFSNPDLMWNGEPAGTSIADNRKTLNNTAFTVANFRQAVQPVVVPAAPIPSEPVGNICTRQPTFKWNASTGATWYQVWVTNSAGDVEFKQWFEASKTCTNGACSATPQITLPLGAHTWSVLAWNQAGASTANSIDFVAGGPPDAPTLISPTAPITDPKPVFKWYALSNVTAYNLRVKNQLTQKEFTKQVNAADVCVGSNCSTTLDNALSSGTYIWMVQASSTCGGWGPWSTGVSFTATIPLAAPVAIEPTGTISTTLPSFKWTQVDGATSYGLEVTRIITTGDARPVISEQRLSPGTICANGFCTFKPASPLASGDYYWRVQARDATQLSPWSNQLNFTIVVSECRVTSLDAPTGAITTQPTFKWTYSGACQMFYPWVVKKSGATAYAMQWLPVSQVCSGNNCTWTPTQALPGAGNYMWSVMGYPGYSWPGTKEFTYQPVVNDTGFISPPWTGWNPRAGAWSVIGSSPSEWYYSNGVPGKWAATYHDGDYAALDYQTTLFRTGCTDCANAITIRGSTDVLSDGDWMSGYQFQYSNAGRFSVYKGVNGTWTALQYWSSTAAIKPNNWNVLRVVASGSNLYYYINNVLVWMGADASLTTGKAGIVMSRVVSTNPYGDGLFVSNAKLTVPNLSTKSLPDKLDATQQSANDEANKSKTGKVGESK